MDRFDLKILDALQREGRLTNQELAEEVGLSASQCSRRRSALEQDGTIEGYPARLSADAVGLPMMVYVQVMLRAHSPDNSRRFQALVAGLDEVLEAYSLTGETDYQLKIVVPDLPSLSTLLNDVLLAHDTVARLRSSIVLDRLKDTRRLPLAHALARGLRMSHERQ